MVVGVSRAVIWYARAAPPLARRLRSVVLFGTSSVNWPVVGATSACAAVEAYEMRLPYSPQLLSARVW